MERAIAALNVGFCDLVGSTMPLAKPSKEWDAAVRQVQLRSGAVSLACVFLTDPASGLGRHASNPDQPGCCWCRALYGHLTKEAYLSIVEEPSKLKQEELDFKKIDAAAMGQVFLVKQDGESDADWQVRKEAAEKEAEEKCEQKQGLAPWGCEWFHLWKNRVTGWWFGTFFIFPYIGNNHPN